MRPPASRTRSTAHEKRAFFTERWVGIALIVPQLVLIFTFFYWPAGEALYWAFTLERPWGGGNAWVGFGNFAAILGDPVYWNSIVRSLVFAFAVLPQVLLFVGQTLVSKDGSLHYIADHADIIWKVPLAVAALAAYYAALSLAVSSLTARRIVAGASIFGITIVSSVVAGILRHADALGGRGPLFNVLGTIGNVTGRSQIAGAPSPPIHERSRRFAHPAHRGIQEWLR